MAPVPTYGLLMGMRSRLLPDSPIMIVITVGFVEIVMRIPDAQGATVAAGNGWYNVSGFELIILG